MGTREPRTELRLGDEAPDFTAETSEDTLIRFHEWKGESWALFFSHPADFTPVCTTELGAVASLKAEFEERDTKVIALSVDPLITHYRWLNDIERITGTAVDFPIVADPNRYVASLYGMVHPKADSYRTVRTTVIVGPSNKVEFLAAHPPGTGRDFQEVLRVIDSLQRTWKHGVATPAGWHPGEAVLIPVEMSGEEAEERFPGQVEEKAPYFRVIPDPGA